MKIEVKFDYHVMAEPLEEQAKQQGFELKDATLLNELLYSANKLWFQDLLTFNEHDKVINKIHKKVMGNLILIKESDGNE